MDLEFSKLVERAKKWGHDVSTAGWVNSKSILPLVDYDARTPGSLFEDQTTNRPLIVSFFGGTGVGKSSLLNRLANKEIARTGVERPTSREVTLFFHGSVSLAQLPKELPVTDTRMVKHDNEEQKDVIWIDMPDMDSTDLHNKQLVINWLPHIDVLVYVVSPERYRDEKAWRLLQQEGGKHAWIFVINQWDKGVEGQYDDFIGQLNKAGFRSPVIFKTICSGEEKVEDEFSKLQHTIQSITNEHTVKYLKQIGLFSRKEELKQLISKNTKLLGTKDISSQLTEQWDVIWQKTTKQLNQGFEWPLRTLAKSYAVTDSKLLRNPFKKSKPDEDVQDHDVTDDNSKNGQELWDGWSQSRFEDAIDKMILEADKHNLNTHPLKHEFSSFREQASQLLQSQVEINVRNALANPGNSVQRFFLKLTKFLSTVLPLLAMAWAGYKIYYGYYQSGVSETSYLGTEFAVHSLLLIGISWIIPYFLHKKLQPSIEKTAYSGLQKGVQKGLAAIHAEAVSSINTVDQNRLSLLETGNEIMIDCDTGTENEVVENRVLSRMLVH